MAFPCGLSYRLSGWILPTMQTMGRSERYSGVEAGDRSPIGQRTLDRCPDIRFTEMWSRLVELRCR